jgi:hypothetical protein
MVDTPENVMYVIEETNPMERNAGADNANPMPTRVTDVTPIIALSVGQVLIISEIPAMWS